MAKIKQIQRSEATHQYYFVCPGCNEEHAFDDRWKFNKNFDKPTISPSFLQKGYRESTGNYICHSFIKNGMIQFLDDCTHELKGKTVELPEIE